MTITARYAGTCTKCSSPIAVGVKIEWTKGTKPAHTECPQAVAPATTRPARRYYAEECDDGHRTYRPSCFFCRNQIG